MTIRQELLDDLENFTINKYAKEYEEYERNSKSKSPLDREPIQEFTGRSNDFHKLDMERIKNHKLKTSFKFAVNKKEKDEFVFDMLNLPPYSIDICLENQSTQDLFLLAKHIETNIKSKANSPRSNATPQIKAIADDYLDAERDLLDIVKTTFKERMKSGMELSSIKNNSDKYLAEKYHGWSFKRVSKGVRTFFSASPEDKYIDMYKHHLKYVSSHTQSSIQTKSELLKGKVMTLANEYFNAHGQKDKTTIKLERIADLSGVNANEVVSYSIDLGKKGIQFKIRLKDKSEFSFGLTESELLKYAIMQYDFKQKYLTALPKSDETEQSLAEKYLVETNPEKACLTSNTTFQRDAIVDCTMVMQENGKYNVMVYTKDKSESFELTKMEAESFAIIQFNENQKNALEIKYAMEARERILNEIKNAKQRMEHLAEQYIMENAKDKYSESIDAEQMIRASIKPDKSKNYVLTIEGRDSRKSLFNLSKRELEDFAIEQFQKKKESLKAINDAKFAIEDLAREHLLGPKKQWLALASKIAIQKISNCHIAQDNSGKYILNVSLDNGQSKRFILNKVAVEDFAVEQYKQNKLQLPMRLNNH